MSTETAGWRFFEGSLEHKGKQGRGYQTLWCVLKGRTIHIFKERDHRNDDTVVGSLNIDNKTECTASDTRDGYKLELMTEGLDKTRRVNRFKTKKKVEREIWRGYILCLSKGTVPNDLDLTDTQIEEIKASVNSFLLEEASGSTHGGGSLSIGGKSRHQELSKRASVSPSEDSGLGATIKHPRSIGTQNSSSSGSRGTISGGGGGPTMRHKFTNNPRMDDQIPSWFFSSCSRDLAERILVNSGSLGNTLMRESSSQKVSGSYVISKIGKIDGVVKIEHFEVERVDRGYKIKVENDHEPQKNLTDVINTFRFIAGFENTIPMKTNDLYDFGLSEDDSNPYRMKRIEREIPSKTRELPEPLPGSPSPPEFDPPAPHRQSVYYNAPESNAAKFFLQKPRPPTPPDESPPPPEPHVTGSDGYYNEDSFKDLKGKEPLHKRSMSVPNIKHLMPNQLQGDIDLNQPVNRDIPPPKSVVPAAPPPPPLLSNPGATSPTQKTPTSILKSKPRGGLPSLPSLPPTPTEPDTGPRSSIDTSAPSLTALGLKPVGRNLDKQKTSSSSPPSNHAPSPQQLGLRHVERATNKEEQATKEYEDSQTVQDIRKKFEKKIPPSTAPKPTGRPQARAASNEKEEMYDDAISVEYENNDDIPKGIGKRSSFIRKLEEQIARPAAGPQGAPKVPEIKPMTEEEECEYHEVV
ncbi:uncharacterized protein LOC128176461 isoform X8 [Crassostrea angulata]|uniref:uncharacterized protein LOC128176461 isoform X8 n=1 Tax=Magallana angulata TaxID=2784310 RepID=UPI0022B207DD|nr:uncharacterized protein LOC128176461 isoform X8 [Crassostrea angulata]